MKAAVLQQALNALRAVKDSPGAEVPAVYWQLCMRAHNALEAQLTADAVAAKSSDAGLLPLEMALSELIDKIVPGLDSGDLLADARTASAALTQREPIGEVEEIDSGDEENGPSAWLRLHSEVALGAKVYLAPASLGMSPFQIAIERHRALINRLVALAFYGVASVPQGADAAGGTAGVGCACTGACHESGICPLHGGRMGPSKAEQAAIRERVLAEPEIAEALKWHRAIKAKRAAAPSLRIEGRGVIVPNIANGRGGEPVPFGARQPDALDIIEMLCNGIEWNMENHPTVMNESDNEALQQAREFVVKARAAKEAAK